jgi:hypothetical protein
MTKPTTPVVRATLDSPEAIERWRVALHQRYMNVDLVDSLCDLALKGLGHQSESKAKDVAIWEVFNRTSSILFGTEEAAKKFVSGFSASVSGGMTITKRYLCE